MEHLDLQAELRLMRAQRAELDKLLMRKESLLSAFGIVPFCIGMALAAVLLYSMGMFSHG